MKSDNLYATELVGVCSRFLTQVLQIKKKFVSKNIKTQSFPVFGLITHLEDQIYTSDLKFFFVKIGYCLKNQ